jgi:hypothetical protein
MAPSVTRARANVDRATALPEVWALVAKYRGVLGARRLMRVCRAARAGATEFLRTLPGLVVCGGLTSTGVEVSDVRRLNLATLRWEPMPSLAIARMDPGCCTVRGADVVLGGETQEGVLTSSVEMLSSGQGGAFVDLPPLSLSVIYGAAAIAVDESDSAAGLVLLLGGGDENNIPVSTVQPVDLATGDCAPQNNLLRQRG